MKALIISLLGLCLFCKQSEARCIRVTKKGKPIHVNKKTVTHAGISIETKNYECSVRADELKNFDDGYCKNCGCHMYDHDNIEVSARQGEAPIRNKEATSSVATPETQKKEVASGVATP